MPDIRILTESELRQSITLDIQAVDIIEQAFGALAQGGVVMPPILSMSIEEKHGEVDVKTAYVPGMDAFAIKASPGFFDNPAKGLPSLNGLMILFDSDTGILKSVLLDNGYLTDVRTAAAGAVAARHLAPDSPDSVGIIGAGVQAVLQLQALSLVRNFNRVRVWARNPERAADYARRMSEKLGVPVETADTAEQCVRESQVVITTTPARAPVIQADWLQRGQHITAMGSDSPDKNELDPEIVVKADRFVCDRRSQSLTRGELRSAVAAGLVAEDYSVDELGEIIAGKKTCRTGDTMITVCDLTGTGVQDTAIANHAYQVTLDRGAGTSITT
ncbi:MAG: Delta(1)-pyrroline-2-carboxylate reductase [Gammaproteobacteria bacterium]|nr:Delta(1)-pyrroline-2-carboxylate reductase [Gammaproteobacteria bacterium]